MIPIIVPAYEPDEKLIKLLENIEKAGLSPVIVVDDGSIDEKYHVLFNTAAAFPNVTVLHHEVNKGKGRALKTAFEYCLKNFPDMTGTVTIDSDGQHRVEDMEACMEAMQSHPNALIMGCRAFDADNVPLKSRIGNTVTALAVKYMVGLSISDTQTGLRGIPTEFMKLLLDVKGERFEFETNMLMEAKRLRMEVLEVPIKTIYLEENKSSHYNPLKDSLRICALFAKFLFSSLSSSIIDLVLFSLFCGMLKGMEPHGVITYITLSTVLARVLSATYNFLINYKLVFKSSEKIGKTLLRYIALAVVQMSLSALLVNFLYPRLGGFEVVIKIIVDVILFLLSYVIQREFVYNGSGN